MSNADLPLSGVRILDVATFVAAPYCATILSEFGAEVIKVEEPARGDPFRRFGTATERADSTLAWLSEARNKKSITLNLRTSEGATLFRRLIHYADVICENFRPGTLERWGLGWDELSGINPKLILLRMTGYGQTGPHRDRPGFARIAHAIGGLAALAGMPDGPPVTPGSTSLGDYLAGLYGAVGVLIALLHVRAGGPGQVVDIGLYEAVFRVLDELAPAYARAGIVREREGAGTRNACPHGTPPRLVTTGRVVAVGTSGGISMLGMLATLTGGAMIGLAAGLLPHGILWSIALPLGLLSGLAGSLIDSLLGASLQRQGYCPSCQAATEARIHHCGAASKLTRGCSWLGNDAVNFLASLAGGLIALVFWLCLIGIGA